MSDSKNNTRILSSDEMWARAGQVGSISKEELGIQGTQSSKGTTSLNEGTQKWTFELNNDNKSPDK